ncbi:MAG: Ku protein, partial [Burkholderiaceae bacterium]
LAALIPSGATLMLNTIRWASEIRPTEGLSFPPAGKSASGLRPTELKMAAQLIGDMTTRWKAEDYEDTFSGAVRELVNRKVAAGDTETVTTPTDEPSTKASGSNVVDLTELLARSLGKRRPGADSDSGSKNHAPGARPPNAKKPPRRAARKRA